MPAGKAGQSAEMGHSQNQGWENIVKSPGGITTIPSGANLQRWRAAHVWPLVPNAHHKASSTGAILPNPHSSENSLNTPLPAPAQAAAQPG